MSLRERNAIVAAGLIVSAVTILAVITCWNGIQVNEDRFSSNIRKRRSAEEDEFLWILKANDVASTLTSPNYPEAYPSNADCLWLIEADDPGATVSLKIEDLVIEADEKCRLDYLMVYLGDSKESPSLGPFCGHIQDKLIETNTSQILLEFHSDMLGEEKGFSVDYFTHKEGDCRKSITDGSGTLQSPGFPENYPDDSDCWTVIKAGDGKKVMLTFDFVDLEFGDNCTFDYVRVYDGETENSTLLGSMCQEEDSKTFQSSASSLLVHFHSDDTVNRKGYKARYSSLDKRNKPIGDCFWQIGADNGTITSPNYPEKYSSSSYCSIWIFAPEDSTVSIDMDTLVLEMDHNCTFDYLRISEGPSSDSKVLGKLCGLRSEPKQLVSTRHEVHIEFQSDNFIEFSGFKLQYHFVKEETATLESPENRMEETSSFSAKPGNITLSKGSSSMLPCSTEYPNARIRWLKGHIFLSGETPLPGLRLLPNNSIWIQSMDFHLKGVYTCIVVSPESEEATSAYVAMTDSQPCSVEFRKTPSDAEFEENDFAYLECLSSEEQTVLSWEKDGRPLATDDRVGLLENGYIAFRRIELQDAGIYTCIATDTVSGCSQKAVAELKVTKRVKIEEICGRAKLKRPNKLSHSPSGHIVGGNDAPKGAYPWQVMLWNPLVGPFCAGALINERWVLTAAHCLVNKYDFRWDSIRLLLGKHARERGGEPEVEGHLAGPSSMRIHPAFRKLTFDNDLALMRLDHTVRFTDNILPVCLGDRNVTETLLTAGTMGTVIGWGRLKENGAYPKYLQEIRLPIVEQARCKASTNFTVTRNMFCAGYAQEVIGDACTGDSGGPFLVEHEGKWHMVGVVSWGDGCGKKNKFGFYTRIANHLSWIQSIIQT